MDEQERLHRLMHTRDRTTKQELTLLKLFIQGGFHTANLNNDRGSEDYRKGYRDGYDATRGVMAHFISVMLDDIERAERKT
jgi:hypothetical protein